MRRKIALDGPGIRGMSVQIPPSRSAAHDHVTASAKRMPFDDTSSRIFRNICRVGTSQDLDFGIPKIRVIRLVK